MKNANLNNPANYQLATMAQRGFRIITGVDQLNNPDEFYNAIFIVGDASITSLTAESGDSIVAATDFVAGMQVLGLFSEITIASGTVIAYIA